MIHNEDILTSTSESMGTKGKKKHIGQQKDAVLPEREGISCQRTNHRIPQSFYF